MKKHKFKAHFSHYIPLLGICLAGLVGFLMFSYDKNFLMGISFALSASYIAWGIAHHLIHKDLNIWIVIEYVGISILGLVVLISIILRM